MQEIESLLPQSVQWKGTLESKASKEESGKQERGEIENKHESL